MPVLESFNGIPLHRWSDEEVKSFWDYHSSFHSSYFSRDNANFFLRYFRYLPKSRPSALDYGCGDGGLIESILESPFKPSELTVSGFDYSPESASKVADQFSGHPNFLGAFSSFQSLQNSPSCKFDLIYCLEVIEHCYDDNLDLLLTSLRSLLKSHGVVVLSNPLDEDLTKQLIFNPVDSRLFHAWQHVRSWSVNELSNTLISYGLRPVDILKTSIVWHRNSFLHSIYRRLRYPRPANLIVVASLN